MTLGFRYPRPMERARRRSNRGSFRGDRTPSSGIIELTYHDTAGRFRTVLRT